MSKNPGGETLEKTKENRNKLCPVSGLNHQHHSPSTSALPVDQSGMYTIVHVNMNSAMKEILENTIITVTLPIYDRFWPCKVLFGLPESVECKWNGPESTLRMHFAIQPVCMVKTVLVEGYEVLLTENGKSSQMHQKTAEVHNWISTREVWKWSA